ncbi:Eukaryotic translation initiation factor 3 subunit A, partial [Orchesella cincta]
MSRYYQRPENALKKATEFIEVGKPTRALDTLYDVIKGKKHRSFSEKVIEPIMLKYLELCVELKKPHTAKEGLYQYRLMCQSVNVGLLEKVIRSYIRMAEEKTETAKALIEKKTAADAEASTEPISIVEVDDLDNLSMADMTLLNVITEEQAQERSGRAALIPWVKFLWESYTQCLDLLRNNPRLENLYHDIAQMAFKFCLAYSRKTEFRKLCERLRKHFDDIINRQGSQMNSIDFSSPETQQLNMETRLSQLDSAITLELWQEAYKAIEDIHLLMNQSKKSQTRMMAYYYQKLSLVFWKAGNLLFHAATLMKYYLLCKDMKKNVSADELQKNASQVVLATMAIPFPVLHPEFERFVETDKGMLEKSQKLATLLFLPQPPTRASMIRDISRHGILTNAIKPLQDLYEILETQFSPLSLCADVDGLLKTAADGEHPTDYMEQYIDPLREVTLVRLIKQISQVYQTIDYAHLMSMTVFSNQTQLEQILVDAVRYNDMQITVDHRSNCVKFGSSLAEASREDLPEGPHLQIMPSETVRLQLVNVMDCLQDTVDMISPVQVSSEEDIIRGKILAQLRQTEVQYHRSLIARQKIIAERREELERSAVDKEYEEKLRAEQMIKQQMMMEAKRLETEREEREKKKVESEALELKNRRMQERIKQIGQTPIGLKIIEKFQGEESSKMDLETVLQRQQEELQKEAKEHLIRMKSQEKRLDHVERAKRIEEISVIEQYMGKKKEEEKVEWEAHEAERIAHLIEERKIAVANRDRMKRMRDDKDKFLKNLLDARRDTFMEKLNEFEKSFQAEKSRRMAERKDQRKQERRRKYDEEKAAAERARLDAIRKAKEEEERTEREKIEKELEERNRVTLEKQLAKQREIEERQERDRRNRPKAPESAAAPPPAAEVWRAKSATGEKGTPSAPPSARAAAAPAPAGGANVWVPKAIREKKAAAMTGDLPPQENVPPPRERPERQERDLERGDRGEREREREPDFDRGQMRERPKNNDREERPFERKIERGPDGDRDGERKRMDRGGDRERDWGRGGGDRGIRTED